MNLEDIPIANWPIFSGSGSYKVLQLYVGDKPALRFQRSADEEMHTEIMQGFILEHGVPYRVVGSLVYPTEPCRLVGTGMVSLEFPGQRMAFYGESTSYKMKISSEHVQALQRELPFWKLSIRD